MQERVPRGIRRMVRYTLILPAPLLSKARAQADREGLDVAKFIRKVLIEATRNVYVRTEEPAARKERMRH